MFRISWKGRWRSVGVPFRGPVVLATQCRPAEFLVEEVGDGEGFVDGWVEGVGDGGVGGGGQGEEGCGGRGVGEGVVRVDVCEVLRMREMAVEEAGEEDELDLWWEEGGQDVETYLESGRRYLSERSMVGHGRLQDILPGMSSCS